MQINSGLQLKKYRSRSGLKCQIKAILRAICFSVLALTIPLYLTSCSSTSWQAGKVIGDTYKYGSDCTSYGDCSLPAPTGICTTISLDDANVILAKKKLDIGSGELKATKAVELQDSANLTLHTVAIEFDIPSEMGGGSAIGTWEADANYEEDTGATIHEIINGTATDFGVIYSSDSETSSVYTRWEESTFLDGGESTSAKQCLADAG